MPQQPGSRNFRRRHHKHQQRSFVGFPKFETLADDLTINRLASLWPTTVGTVDWTAGDIDVQVDTSYSSALAEGSPYDLTGSHFYINMAPYQDTSVQTSLQFVPVNGSQNGFFFGLSGSNFNVTKVVSGTQTAIYNNTYNATSMAWMRVRELAGTTFFETSQDGVQGFENGVSNWVAAGNCSIAGTSVAAHSGQSALQITATASGMLQASSCLAANFATQMLPVVPGDIIQAAIWFQAATIGRVSNVAVQWYTSAGASISTTAGTSVTSTTSNWTQSVVTGAVAPATAAFARLLPQIAGAAGSGEIHYVDDAELWWTQFSTVNTTFNDPLNAMSLLLFCGDFGSDPTGTTKIHAINTPLALVATSFSGAPTASIAMTASATGAKRETQSDSAAIAMAASATGHKVETQAKSAAIAMAASATGHKVETQAKSAAIAMVASATGVHHGVQADTASFTLTASCTGHKSVAASVSASTAYVASETGAKRETQSKTASFTITGSNTGIHHGLGADTASVAFTGSATGAKRETQAASAAVTMIASATGQIGSMSGAATASFTITASCTGHKAGVASDSATVAFIASNTGSKRETQAATAAVQLSATNTGSKREVASGSALIALSGTSAGSKRVTASDSAAVALAGTATGIHHGTGSKTATFTITASCTGAKRIIQSDTATIILAGSATGIHHGVQAATASFAMTGSAAGIHHGAGLATASFLINVSGNAANQFSGSATAAFTITASCTGAKRETASVTATLAMTATATGAKRETHSVTATFALTTSALGAKRAIGAKSALLALSGSNTGSKRGIGSPTASLSFNLLNAGTARRAGAAAAILEFLLSGFQGNPTRPGTNVTYPPGTVYTKERANAPYYDQMGEGKIVMLPIGREHITVYPVNGQPAVYDAITWTLYNNPDGSITLNRPQTQGWDGVSP